MSTSFNFPTSPTLNQIVVLPDGNSAQWNGYAWVAVGDNVTYPLAVPKGGTGATNPFTAKRNLDIPIWTLDDTAPVAPVFGDRWIRPGSMTEVVWLPNSTPAGGGVWVNLADVGSVVYPIPVSKGGTGATTAAGARTNLGIDPLIAALLPLDGSRPMTGALLHTDGTGVAPGIAFAAEPGTGFYRAGPGIVNLAALGAYVGTFNFNTAAIARMDLYPRAAGTSTLFLFNQPVATPNVNYAQIGVSGNGDVVIASGAAGSATRGKITLDAPGVLIAGVPGLTINDPTASGGSAKLQMTTPGGAKTIRVNSANGLDILNAAANTTIASLSDTGNFAAKSSLTVEGHLTLWDNGSSVIYQPQATFTYNWSLVWDHATGLYHFTNNVGSDTFQFDGSGNANKASGAGGWNAIASDVRVKQDIEDYTEGLAAVLALRPRRYRYLPEVGAGDGYQLGYVEQEARGILPSMPSLLAEKLGIPDLANTDHTPVSYMLVNAIKTLDARLKAAGL